MSVVTPVSSQRSTGRPWQDQTWRRVIPSSVSTMTSIWSPAAHTPGSSPCRSTGDPGTR